MATGSALANGVVLAEGDGLATSDEGRLTLVCRDQGEVLLFDLA